jgi:hypothetical protein
MVERSAVNRNVGSSNLPRGANSRIHLAATLRLCLCHTSFGSAFSVTDTGPCESFLLIKLTAA